MTARRPPRAWRSVREPLDWDLSPAEVLRMVRADAHPAALLGAWAGGCDIIAAAPAQVRSGAGAALAALDERWPGAGAGDGADGGPVFAGGWIGYLGYGLAGRLLPVPPAPGPPPLLPAAWLGFYDHVLRRDRATGRWFFEALETPGRAGLIAARRAELTRRARSRPRPAPWRCGEFTLTPSAAEHRAAVARAVAYIRAGDIFQANICLRLEAGFDGDPLDAFCAAASALDPPHAAFLRPSPGAAVASLSPELFLRRTGRSVITRPIKGTGARPADPQSAAQARAALERSAKNRAENVMIVDLMRNDLSRVCRPGTVTVPALAQPQPHPGVWHLVSEVTGELSEQAGDGELIAATFPPGSVTGAPKVRALEVIAELEATAREVYTGAIGYRSPVAGLELNVAIRTFEFAGDRVWLGAGGGIVAASRPAAEYAECLLKASPLIAAIGGTTDTRTRRRDGTSPALMPRPAAGVFTSVAVRDGAVAGLADHLARLAASARDLYGRDLPAALPGQLARCLAGAPSGRLRITVAPRGGPLQARVECVPLPDDPPAAVGLIPVVVPGGLGRHKWADRRLLASAAADARAGPGDQLLLTDAGGSVLETDRASIFAVVSGELVTPAADGRLLPGITAAAVLALAGAAGVKACARPLHRDELAGASEMFVTSSVRGVTPVRSLDGTTLASPGPVTAALAAALAGQPAVRQPGPDAAGPPGQAPALRRLGRGRGRTAAPLVVLIDNYDSFTYNLAHYLAVAGCTVEVVRNDEVTAGQVTGLGPDGVLISPGPCTPDEAGISVEVVAASSRLPLPVPVLGVCLGCQAIAACYGAAIMRAARPVHGQTSLISHDGLGVLAGLPRRLTATRYHSLIVDEATLPPELSVTARTRAGTPMGLRHQFLPVEGVQFHPESVLTPAGQSVISSFAALAARRRARAGEPAGT